MNNKQNTLLFSNVLISKSLYTLLTMLLCIPLLHAQQSGIKAGVNFAGLYGNDAGGFKGITNFHVGFVNEISLFDNFSLQPEILYSGQGAESGGEEYKLNYINVPVMAKFYFNDAFSIQVGPQAGLLLLHTKDFEPAEPDFFDFGFAAGLEYLTSEGLFVQGRYNWGTTSVFEEYDVKNSVLQFSVGYMF